MVVDGNHLALLRHHVAIDSLLADQPVPVAVEWRQPIVGGEARRTDETLRRAIDVIHELHRKGSVRVGRFGSANVAVPIDVNGRDARIQGRRLGCDHERE